MVHNKHVLFDRHRKKKKGKMLESDQPSGSTSQIPTLMITTVGQLDNFDPKKNIWSDILKDSNNSP